MVNLNFADDWIWTGAESNGPAKWVTATAQDSFHDVALFKTNILSSVS